MMETNEANGVNSDYIAKNTTSKVHNLKASTSSMLNNFSVERILSENTQPANHIKSNLSNGFCGKNADRKRRLLDANIDSVSLTIDETKLPRISLAVDSSVENKLDFSSKFLLT